MLTDHQVVIEMALWHVRNIFHIWENSHGAKMRRARLEAITRALINHDRLLINGEIPRRGYVIRPQ